MGKRALDAGRVGVGGWFGIGVLVGVFLSGFGLAVPISSALALAACTATAGFRRPTLAVFAGFLIGGVAVVSQPEGPALEGTVSVRGRVVAPPQGRRVHIAVSAVAPGVVGWRPDRGRIVARFPEGEVPLIGDELVARGRAEAVSEALLPGAPDAVRNLRRARIRSRLVVAEWSAVGAVPASVVVPSGRHGAVLLALGRGRRVGVPPEVLRLLRATGTSHLLAISGFHVGLVAGLGVFVVRGALRLLAVARPRGVPVGGAYLFGALLACGYAWAAGAPVSAQRAALMVCVLCVGRALVRSIALLDLLGIAAALVAVSDPSCVGEPAFQLSFGAILGIVRIASRLPHLPSRAGRYVLASLGATLGATVGTLPAVAWWFQEVALSSPLANLLAMPWVALCVVPWALVACWAPAPLDALGTLLGTAAVDVLLWGLEPFVWPMWTPAIGPLVALLGAVALVLPSRASLGALLIGLALVERAPADSTVVTVLGVRGAAVLVEQAGGLTWLVDGGSAGGAVVRYARRRGLRRIDVVAATSGRREHAAGLVAILEGLVGGEVWIANHEGMAPVIEAADARDIAVRYRPPGLLHPPAKGFYPEESVERGLVLRLAAGRNGVLIPGDLGARGEAEALRRAAPVDLLVVGNHGSASSSSPAWIAALRPRIAVVPDVGRVPSPDVLRRLEGAEVFRTQVDGTVEVRLGPDRAVVRCWRAGSGWSEARAIALEPPQGERDQSVLVRDP